MNIEQFPSMSSISTENPGNFQSAEELSHKVFIEKLSAKLSPADVEFVDRAYDLAKRAHKGADREGGGRYFNHVRSVALILLEEAGVTDKNILAAALLHDSVEDTSIFGSVAVSGPLAVRDVARQRIAQFFSDETASYVMAVTKIHKTEDAVLNSQYKKLYFEELKSAPYGAILIKMADRIHNLRSVAVRSRNKQQDQYDETRDVLLPIFEKQTEALSDQKIEDKVKGEILLSLLYNEQENLTKILSKKPEINSQSLSDHEFPSERGYSDNFHEMRFNCDPEFDINLVANKLNLSFLSKTVQLDEYYSCTEGIAGLPAGIIRIREEGNSEPLVTIKETQKNGREMQTIDIVYPEEGLIDSIRKDLRLLSVIEKTRTTFRSKEHPDCLLHRDSVRGLGDFLDLKADSAKTMQMFLDKLGLDKNEARTKNYLQSKIEKGVSPIQLKVWKFHKKFKDYVMGVVSGTLTPLGFLSATLASSDSRTAMVVALLSAGICDGIGDSVAAGQHSQSSSNATPADRLKLFLKTMAGKVVIPASFVPIALMGSTNLSIGVMTAAWASVLLASTAAIQAIACERNWKTEVKKILFWGGCSTAAGTLLGKFVPWVLEKLL